MAKFLLSSFLVFMLYEQQQIVATPMPFDECIAQLKQEILDDVYLSFPILTEVQRDTKKWTFTYKSLSSFISNREEKRNRQLESLLILLKGASMGDKHLVIIKDHNTSSIKEATRGYIHYKELNGTNILLEIKRNKHKWKIVEKRIATGKYITFKDIGKDCVKD